MRRQVLAALVALMLAVAIAGGAVAADGIAELGVFTRGTGTLNARLTEVEDFLVVNSRGVKAELGRMQGEIDALEDTPTPTIADTLRPAHAVPIETLTATDFWQSFQDNEYAAREKYAKQVVQVSGAIARIAYYESYKDLFVHLDISGEASTVSCRMLAAHDSWAANLSEGQEVAVIGYYADYGGGWIADVQLKDCAPA